jgi:homoserine dehydrogenase
MNSMAPVRVGIVGLGTVGTGTVNVLQRNRDEITRRAGRAIAVKTVCVRDLSKKRDCDLTAIGLVDDPMIIANDPEIDVVIELIGGVDLARDVVAAAIENGKHIVTANKALIAERGGDLFLAAQESGVTIAFEAAVGGGISIIKVIREGLAGNRVEWLAGIVNGTCNYILTAMHQSTVAYADVLAEAQQLGYAEADPSADVDGFDAAHKLTILCSIAFGIPLNFDAVYVEGIAQLDPVDIEYAKELGYRIKHLGIAARVPLKDAPSEQGIDARVHPALVPRQRLLANVDGVMNAIWVFGDAVGQTLHHGAGAGAEPTASAVVADIVDVVRTLTTDPDNRVPHLAFQPDALTPMPMIPIDDCVTAFYLRMQAVNRPGVLAKVTHILGDLGISIETIVQKGSGRHEEIVPIIIITQRTRESNMNLALEQLAALDDVIDAIVRIRLEDLS